MQNWIIHFLLIFMDLMSFDLISISIVTIIYAIVCSILLLTWISILLLRASSSRLVGICCCLISSLFCHRCNFTSTCSSADFCLTPLGFFLALISNSIAHSLSSTILFYPSNISLSSLLHSLNLTLSLVFLVSSSHFLLVNYLSIFEETWMSSLLS